MQDFCEIDCKSLTTVADKRHPQ